jgi:hypothetical protein
LWDEFLNQAHGERVLGLDLVHIAAARKLQAEHVYLSPRIRKDEVLARFVPSGNHLFRG